MFATVPQTTYLHFKSRSSKPSRWRSSSAFPVLTRATSLSQNPPLFPAAKLTVPPNSVDTYIENGMVVGLGSGQASALAIQYLGRQLRAGAFKGLVGIPMSVGSAFEAVNAGLPLNRFGDISHVDFAFNDADVMEEGTLFSVIGRRKLQEEESIIEEKQILNAASKLVFMVTENQYKVGPEGSIPVLVQSLGWMETAEELEDLFVGDAEVWRRSCIEQAGPTGGDFPYVTREGEVAEILEKVGGVVDHGIISKYPCTAVIASENGARIVENLPTVVE